MKRRKVNHTTKIILGIACFLLVANIILGEVLYTHSEVALEKLLHERMLDVSNTAAALLDGDVMRDLQAEDADTPEYQEQLEILARFQQNIELEYIYGIRQMEDGSFTFTVDPEPYDPGEFGAPVVTTDALENAYKGIPTVDRTPYTDRWGRFYSAYTPIFDSNGDVVGVIAVDFSAEWYEAQLRENAFYIAICSAISMFVGALIIFILTGQIRRRFKDLIDDVSDMSADLRQLTDDARHMSKMDYSKIMPEDDNPVVDESHDSIDEIKLRIDRMHKELKAYLNFAQLHAYLDSMTGVSNKTAYLEHVHQIEEQIEAEEANFSVVVFDINGLKKVNDYFGHEEGDRIIVAAANVICDAFGQDNVFRIGGDEFIAVLMDKDQEDIKKCYKELDIAIDDMNNSEPPLAMALAISRGSASYVKGEDLDFNKVFKRADEEMYRNKAEFYMERGDRRDIDDGPRD